MSYHIVSITFPDEPTRYCIREKSTGSIRAWSPDRKTATKLLSSIKEKARQ